LVTMNAGKPHWARASGQTDSGEAALAIFEYSLIQTFGYYQSPRPNKRERRD